jgi:serine/threonine protein kinase
MATTSEYWVGATIGEGSYGKVVYARHKSTEKNVAIKVVTKLSLKICGLSLGIFS